MKTNTEILEVWKEILSAEPDISTERALEMTRQRCGLSDIGPVVDALESEEAK